MGGKGSGPIRSTERAREIGKKTQFKKKGVAGGNPRNVKGRPPVLPGLDVLLAEVLSERSGTTTAAKAIIMRLRNEAISGNIRAAEILLDRAYGKSKQKIELSNPEGESFKFGYGEEKPV